MVTPVSPGYVARSVGQRFRNVSNVQLLTATMSMTAIRTICSEVRSNAVLMRRLNGWLTIAWIVMIPVSIALGWIDSVAYVSALSLWALVSGHWAAWQAARVEVEQQRQQRELVENPPEERIVEAIVEQTNIERTPS